MKKKYPHPKWTKFIWIDYPNANSWKKFRQAKKEKRIPKDAKIGGEIGIHGVPKGKDFFIDLKINWTLGCIALKNHDVNENYEHIRVETKIHITK